MRFDGWFELGAYARLLQILLILAAGLPSAGSASMERQQNTNPAMSSLGAEVGHARYAMSRVPRDCLDPAMSDYPDVQRHLGKIRSAGFCYRRQMVREGRFRWVFHILRHPKEREGPFWLIPHDNENAAFDAAVYAIETYGGGLLAIESGQNRYFRGQDPNRNFSRTWAESALCSEQRRPAPKFTASILEHFEGRGDYPYLALHTNADRWIGNGGRGTVSVYRRDAFLSGFPSAAAQGAFRDEDNLVFIAGLSPPALDRQAQRKVARLNLLGLNVVHKKVATRGFDCSLSDYVIGNGLGDYYSIEVQHGRAGVQREMIDRLMTYLGRRALPGWSRDDNPFLSQSAAGDAGSR